MSDERDEQSRSETSPFDRGTSSGQGSWTDASNGNSGSRATGSTGSTGSSAHGQHEAGQQQYGGDQYGQQQYGQQYGRTSYERPSYEQQYGRPTSGQEPWGQQPTAYGQSAEATPYGYQPPYQQQQYGQQQYGPQQYGPQGYGAADPYGQQYGYGASGPAKPGGVITAAVLGFVFAALGVLVTGVLLIGGAVIASAGSNASSLEDDLPGLGSALGGAFGAVAGIVVVIGLLALAWTVLTIWGSIWALSGRSRVLLIVAGSVSILFTGLGLAGNISDASGGGIVFSLLLFAAAVAIVVLLSVRSASQYFAAHRARRAR